MTDDELSERIMTAIGAAIGGNPECAARILQQIGEANDSHRMYGVCCAIAAAGVKVLKAIYGAPIDGASWAMSEIAPGALLRNPPHTFALRFIVAYANGDTPTCLALYNAALRASDEEYVASVCALLAAVAQLAQAALDRLAN